MPLIRKRRAPSPPASPSASSSSDIEGPRQRRRQNSAGSNGSQTYEETSTQANPEGTSTAQMVKKMVRLALACEYARVPIRRADVGAKVLGQHSRQFKPVFEGAQRELRNVFGMEMTELPIKEKITITQRRAAQKTEKTSASSKADILTSILPSKYRANPTILPPPKVPTSHIESSYVGLYTFLIALISLSGGSVPEAKLERYLRRANADQYTPIDKTEKLLQRLCKEGYLVRLKDNGGGGEEVVEYMVGPRGSLEVGNDGVMGLVKTVYEGEINGDAAQDEELEAKMRKSLGLEEKKRQKEKDSQRAARREANKGSGDGRGRTRQNAAEEEEEDDDQDEEDTDDD